MSDLRSCCSGSQSGTSCIGKQIQNFHGSAGRFDFLGTPVPIDSLFREQTGMFKTERFQMEGERFVADAPLLREIKKFPFSSSLRPSVIVAYSISPEDRDGQGCNLPIVLTSRHRSNLSLHNLSNYLQST